MKRKPNRLKNYNYSLNGLYFITICTQDKKCTLSDANNPITLTGLGTIVKEKIETIEEKYKGVVLDKYVIMPNHIHLILKITNNEWRAMLAATISRVIQHFKGAITKQTGQKVFQRSFHDHVIRNEKSYLEILKYVEENQMKWELDCFHPDKLK